MSLIRRCSAKQRSLSHRIGNISKIMMSSINQKKCNCQFSGLENCWTSTWNSETMATRKMRIKSPQSIKGAEMFLNGFLLWFKASLDKVQKRARYPSNLNYQWVIGSRKIITNYVKTCILSTINRSLRGLPEVLPSSSQQLNWIINLTQSTISDLVRWPTSVRYRGQSSTTWSRFGEATTMMPQSWAHQICVQQRQIRTIKWRLKINSEHQVWVKPRYPNNKKMLYRITTRSLSQTWQLPVISDNWKGMSWMTLSQMMLGKSWTRWRKRNSINKKRREWTCSHSLVIPKKLWSRLWTLIASIIASTVFQLPHPWSHSQMLNLVLLKIGFLNWGTNRATVQFYQRLIYVVELVRRWDQWKVKKSPTMKIIVSLNWQGNRSPWKAKARQNN